MTECSTDRDEVIFHHCMDSGGGAVLKGHQKGHEGVSVQSLKEIVNTWFVLLNHREDNTEDSSKKSDEFSHIWCEWISVCICAFLDKLLPTACSGMQIKFVYCFSNLNVRVSVWD